MDSLIAISTLWSAGDPSRLPLIPTVKFTEDGQRLNLGDGLWNTATGRGTYKFYMEDVEAGQIGFFGTMREAQEPIIISLRLKIENHRIAEIETIVVRDKSQAENLEKRGRPDPLFTETILPADRASREELVKTANMYFSGMQEMTRVVLKHFLGVRYASVSAHSRHIQESLFLSRIKGLPKPEARKSEPARRLTVVSVPSL